MRHRVRIQPYVLPATHRKLRAYAAAQNLTDSAVTEAALAEFLELDNFDEPLIVRRLDSVVEALARLQLDVDVMSKGFGIFARHSFLRGQANTTAEERRRADDIYGAFLARISEEIAAGIRFATEVDKSRNRPTRTRSASDAGGPGRESKG